MNDNNRQPLIGMTLDELREVAASCGLPGFAAKQIADWLYVKRVDSIDAMTNISLKGRERLSASYRVGRFAPKAAARSVDGTVKYLFDGKGGRDIEAVYIPDRDRATLCVSSQAGCRMGCRFCMTGRQGFHGNLTTTDIINQILSIPESESLTNIVFMGMGEPMDNLGALLPALEILTAPWGFAWSPKRITVSTIGKLDELKTLLDTTKVHIAISVHSPVAEQRASLMPVERAYPLKRCSNCCAATTSPTSAACRSNISCGADSTTTCVTRSHSRACSKGWSAASTSSASMPSPTATCTPPTRQL